MCFDGFFYHNRIKCCRSVRTSQGEERVGGNPFRASFFFRPFPERVSGAALAWHENPEDVTPKRCFCGKVPGNMPDDSGGRCPFR